jgi:hypothetical protein
MSDIRIQVAGTFQSAKTVRSPGTIDVHRNQGYSEFTIPHLADYEVVVLQ